MKVRNGLVVCVMVWTAVMSVSARAEGAYTELGFSLLTAAGGGFSATPSDALLRVGYMGTKNFGAEVFAAASVSGDNVTVGPSVRASLAIDQAYGAYLKTQFEVAPRFELFAKAGWARITLKLSAGAASASSSDGSFSYAAGAQWRFAKTWYGQVDYASYYDKSGDTVRGPSISVGYRF